MRRQLKFHVLHCEGRFMPILNSISIDKLARLIGTPAGPTIIDVRTADDFAANPRHLPASVRRCHSDVEEWASHFIGRSTIIACEKGSKLSQGVAAWLRHAGIEAETLDGGTTAWNAAGRPMVPDDKLPRRTADGRTIWVTRSRPKVDRIACPWLIRRFVDANAVFLFVAADEVMGVAERFGATPFDIDGVGWSHRDELCTFDVMVQEFGLSGFVALERLAQIVRGADTARLDLAPQVAGLLAISLGLSRLYVNDGEQLEVGMVVYDALYRWCRDAVDETHDWVSHTPKPKARA
jgi:rhodanese-related sulfurtransferase